MTKASVLPNTELRLQSIDCMQGEVWHKRELPKRHSFDYAISMLRFSYITSKPEALGGQAQAAEPCDVNSACANDAHFFKNYNGTLSQRTTQFTREHGLADFAQLIVFSFPSFFSKHQKPISCFYFYGEAENENSLLYSVAEVTNTPWGEQHHYVLSSEREQQFDKAFHVSPFYEMQRRYQIKHTKALDQQGFTLSLNSSKNNAANKNPDFHSGFRLKRIGSLSEANAARRLRLFMAPIKVSLLIYGNALMIACKRVTFFKHPNKQTRARGIQHD